MILKEAEKFNPETKKQKVIIMGAGPAGLGCAWELSQNNILTTVYEARDSVGGISRTEKRKVGDEIFRFDLGGHRWFTKINSLNKKIQDLMGKEFIWVPRSSYILFQGRQLEYPPKISNALSVLGLVKSAQVIADYIFTKVKNLVRPCPDITFQDWITNRFGYKLFEVYFKSYTEKVWGIPCTQIGAEWAAQRIKGMSLRTAVKNALFTSSKNRPKTLVTKFQYPYHGIGRISQRMKEEIEKKGNEVFLQKKVIQVNHQGNKITSVVLESPDGQRKTVEADRFVSSIPLTKLVQILEPKPPSDVLEATRELRYRDMITVNIAVKKPRITQDTWIYVHDHSFRLGRLHEPKNWSKGMAPKDKSSLVAEYWCFCGDEIWNMKDSNLIDLTIRDLTQKLNFFEKNQVLDAFCVRVPKAYPEYKIGYRQPLEKIKNYMKKLENLQTVGRYGTYKYNNLDHSILTGIYAAKNILGSNYDIDEINADEEYHEEKK